MFVVVLLLACREPPPHEAMRADALRASVEVLASDAMGGREVLSPGRAEAARWLVEQLDETGVVPLPGADSLRVPFRLHVVAWDPAETGIRVADRSFSGGVDVAPFDFSSTGEVRDDAVVFAGYGITAPGLGWDDYEGLDVAGRVVLVLGHGPEEGVPGGRFESFSREAASFGVKADVAARHGAAALIAVTDPRHDGPESLSIDPPRLPSLTPPAGNVPAVHASRAVAEALLAGSGTTLQTLQAALDEGVRPADLAVRGAPVEVRVAADPSFEAPHGENVVAVVPGTDLADEWVVVGAHYDHMGQREGTGDVVYNGADDNASGTAVVLALAEALAARPEPPRRSVAFAWFDAEEAGLLGSTALIETGLVDVDHVVAMLNLDMVGRNPGRPVQVVGEGFAVGWRRHVAAAAAAEGLDVRMMGTEVEASSDHFPFHTRGVPFLGFFTGKHLDYHGLDDEPAKLDYDRMETIARTTWRVLVALADGALTPESRIDVPWLGARVQGTSLAVLGRVDADGEASEAGLREGDVVVQVGAQVVTTARQAGLALAAVPDGALVTLDARRGDTLVPTLVERAPAGWLGVGARALPDATRRALGLPEGVGARVDVREGSGAAAAGLRTGDVIVAIERRAVGAENLRAVVALYGAGDLVRVDALREGTPIVATVRLGDSL